MAIDQESGENGKKSAAKAEEPATAEVVASVSKLAKAVKVAKKAKKAMAKKVVSPASLKGPTAAKPAVKASKAVNPSKAARMGKVSKKAKLSKSSEDAAGEKTAVILDSKVVYEGPLFRVVSDHLIEPGGRESRRDVIRHNGSVVILAVDHGKGGKGKKDPWIVVERQYRHAAGQFLWELPAGKLDAGEEAMTGAMRELSEETGYQARKWTPLMEYFASPGFLGESMKIFLAEGLVAGDAHPEEDEQIDFRLVRLSDLLDLVDKGKIIDGKTLTGVLLYARKLGLKRKK